MQKLPFYLPMIEDDEESVFESWPNGQRTHDKLSSGLLGFIQEISRKSELTSQIEHDRFGNQRIAFYANGCEAPYYVTEDFLFTSTQAIIRSRFRQVTSGIHVRNAHLCKVSAHEPTSTIIYGRKHQRLIYQIGENTSGRANTNASNR